MTRFLTAATVVIVLCAVSSTGIIVRRELLSAAPAKTPIAKPTIVKDWKRVGERGTRFGPPGAPVVITQFSDFQCPYCKRLFETLNQVAAAYPTQVAFVYRHFPIERLHPHARAAAHASECAARHGRFKEMHDVLYQKQDSIGKLSWMELARRAGVNDSAALTNCMTDSSTADRVKSDEEDARQLGIRGTPLVLINEWQIAGAPSFARIDSTVRAILARAR